MEKYLGAFVGIGAGQSLKRIGADEPWIVSCALEFERATGEGTLHIRDNFVTAYHVRLPVVPRDWSPAPDDKAYWKDRGQEVLRAYASGDTLSAYSLMAAEFQAEWTLSQIRGVRGDCGGEFRCGTRGQVRIGS